METGQQMMSVRAKDVGLGLGEVEGKEWPTSTGKRPGNSGGADPYMAVNGVGEAEMTCVRQTVAKLRNKEVNAKVSLCGEPVKNLAS